MLDEKKLERYADVLLWGMETARTEDFRKNDVILVKYHLPALRLAEILYSRILERGMNPVQKTVATPRMEKDFFMRADEKQLAFRVPGEAEFYSNLNGSIFLNAPESITHLKKVDPEKIGKSVLSQKYLRDILDRRESKGALSWTLCIYPTQALAEAAGVALDVYHEQVAKACFLNDPDPVARWREIFGNAQRIKRWLNDLNIEYLEVQSDNMDLRVPLGENRRWIGVSGRNIPSFEIFTSPDWRGIHGVYYADQPSFRSGNYVKGVKLRFDNGKLVDVSAREGEVFLKRQLAMDDGAERVGEFSMTDKRFSKIDMFMANTLFDENYGGPDGNCHLALGSSYENTFSGNLAELTPELKRRLGLNESALHWDFVNTERKTVTAKLVAGRKMVVYDDGEFKY